MEFKKERAGQGFGGLRRAKKQAMIRQQVKQLKDIAKPGDNLRVFYMLYNDASGLTDIVSASAYGHDVQVKECKSIKRIFLPSTMEFDQDGNSLSGPDVFMGLSFVAKAIHRARHQEEVDKILGNIYLQEKSAKEASIKNIDAKYFGGKNAEGTEVMPEVQPLIGSLKFATLTFALACVMGDDGKINPEKVYFISQPLSDTKVNDLLTLVDKLGPEYNKNYIEVEYNIPATATAKGAIAKVKPTAVDSTKITEVYQPDVFNDIVKPALTRLPANNDDARAKNRNFSAADPIKVKEAFRLYALNYGTVVNELKEQDDIDYVKKHAGVFKDIFGSFEKIDLDAAIAEAQSVKEEREPSDQEKELDAIANEVREQFSGAKGSVEEIFEGINDDSVEL